MSKMSNVIEKQDVHRRSYYKDIEWKKESLFMEI